MADEQQRYTATRALIGIFRIVALVAILGSFIVAGSGDSGAIFGVSGGILIAASFALSIPLLVAAEGLQVVLDMEEHQHAIRHQVEAIARLLKE